MNALSAARSVASTIRRRGVPITLADGSIVQAVPENADTRPDSFGVDDGSDEPYGPTILWHMTPVDASRFAQYDDFTVGGITYRVKLPPAIGTTEAGSTAIMTTLTTRMVEAFESVVQLFRIVRAVVDGEPQDETLELAYDDVAAHFQNTPNIDDPSDVGRIKRESFFTTDHIFFYRDQEVGNGWYVRNRTPNSQTYNQVWSILGDPMPVYRNNPRATNRKRVEAMSTEHPPAAIAALGGA